MAEKVNEFGLPIANRSGGTSKAPSAESVDVGNILKVAETLKGQKGKDLRTALVNNRTPTPGLVVSSGLAGALPDSPLVKNMVAISNAYVEAKKLTDDEAVKKAATEKFNKTPAGMAWSSLKEGLRTIMAAGMAIPEFAQGVANTFAGEMRAADIARKKNLPYKGLGMFGTIKSAAEQVDFLQLTNQTLNYEGKRWDSKLNRPSADFPNLGEGFFPSEDVGAGFAARQAALKSYSIPVMRNGKQIGVRPYGLTTPITWVLHGGDIESGGAAVTDLIGEILVSFKLDPLLIASKISKAAKLVAREGEVAKGFTSAVKIAKVEQETQAAAEEVKRLQGLMDELVTSATPDKAGKITKLEDKIREAVKVRTGIIDEAGDLKPDHENLANFLNTETGGIVLDELVGMTRAVDIWKATRNVKGLPPSFRIALAKATTREEVLNVFAPYVAKGEVTAGVLKAGKKLPPVNTTSTISHTTNQSRKSFIDDSARFIMGLPKTVKSMPGKISDKYSTLIPSAKLANINDTEDLANHTYDLLKVTGVPQNIIDDLVEQILTAPSAGEAGFTASAKAFDAIFDANKDKLVSKWLRKVNPALAKKREKTLIDELKKQTRVFSEGGEATSSFWSTRHVNGDKLDLITINGEKINTVGPHMFSEILNGQVYLPGGKEIMDTLSKVQRLPHGEAMVSLGDFLIGNVWKKSVLIRFAYVVRNIMEEQFRLLLTGHVSFYNHPLAAAAMWLGKDEGPEWRRLIQEHNKYRYTVFGDSHSTGRAMDDFLNEELAQEAKNSYLSLVARRDIGAESAAGMTSFLVKGGRAVGIKHERAWEGMAAQIRVAYADPMARKVAATLPGKEDETVEYFLKGEGKKDWEAWASATGEPRYLEYDFAHAKLFSGVDEEGRTISYAARIDELTGGSQALRSLIARGRYLSGGKTFQVPTSKTEAISNVSRKGNKEDLRDINKEFADELKETFAGTGKWSSNFTVNLPQPVKGITKTGNKFADAYNFIPNAFFNWSQRLEKSTTMGPEYTMKYWDAIQDISQVLDPKAITTLRKLADGDLTKIVSADGVALGKNHPVRKVLAGSKRAADDGFITAEEAHRYAERVASEHVAELFYNASEKRQLFHMFRLVAPFAQAWADTIGKWSALGVQNPANSYKIAKSLDWMQDPKSSALYNLTDAEDYYDPNQGFFFQDPTSGERQFFVPFIGTIMARAAGAMSSDGNLIGKAASMITGSNQPQGAPFAMAINPMSFNFATGTGVILPGFSPGVTWSLAALEKIGVPITKMLPTSIRETLEGYLYPFGKPDVSEGIDALLPGNWTRLFGGILGSEKDFAAAFKPVMAHLASSGDYDPLDKLDQTRLTDQTTTFSRWFTVMRGFIGIATPVPAALIPVALAKDKDGSATLQLAVYEQFQKILESNNYDRAKSYGDVIDLYGPSVMYSLVTQGAASNMDSYRMIQEDPDVVSLYPDVFGYIYPSGGYSQEMYKWSLKKKGGRYTVEQLQERATDILRAASKDRLATRAAAEGWSSDYYEEIKRELTKSFGGPTETLMDIGKAERSIIQLEAAINDPRFLDSEAIAGAREYMAMRQVILDKLKPYGLTTMANKSSVSMRTWLAGETAKLIETYPEFGKLFYAVFADELGYEG